MTKADLVEKIQQKAGIETKAGSEKTLNAIMDALKTAIAKDGSLRLIGFGSFKVVKRAARKGRNPRTGKEIKIAAKKVVRFTPGKLLKEAVAKTPKKKK